MEGQAVEKETPHPLRQELGVLLAGVLETFVDEADDAVVVNVTDAPPEGLDGQSTKSTTGERCVWGGGYSWWRKQIQMKRSGCNEPQKAASQTAAFESRVECVSRVNTSSDREYKQSLDFRESKQGFTIKVVMVF